MVDLRRLKLFIRQIIRMSREIELKLAIDPRDVQTLRASSILRDLALKRSPW